MAVFLNRDCQHGNAYRNVRVVRQEDKSSVPLQGESRNGPYYVVEFDPQERTRLIAPFEQPLTGELLEQLLAIPNGYKLLCEKLERAIIGTRGTDVKCFDPVRVSYLPSGANTNFYFAVLGGPQLLDPVPFAKKVISDSPKQSRKKDKSEAASAVPKAMAASGPVPAALKGSLKGVRLASFLNAEHPTLVNQVNNLKPLVLRRCPFADHHTTRRGEADNSVYVYDPDRTPYSKIGCHHQSCARRRTEDFVEAMISAGTIDRANLFENPKYRLIYPDLDRPPAFKAIRNYKKLS